MPRWTCAFILLTVAPALADPSALYLKPAPKSGDKFYDIFSNTDSIKGEGFDAYVKRVGGSTMNTILSANADSIAVNEDYNMDGMMQGTDQFEIRDNRNAICAKDKCRPNTSTSNMIFSPLAWGDIPKNIHVGSSWTATIANPWEIGPAGTETVRVVQIDRANATITLEREGSGTGPTNDDLTRKPPVITKDGKPLTFTLTPGATTWSGYLVVRRGITVSEIIKSERDVALKIDTGETLTGHERNYTLYNLAPTPVD